jgi:7,8-dihydropterin-6-yl-methyl-4-(beta-D-ribofuranosyl)aminobenzene 5'-phosphate synthase
MDAYLGRRKFVLGSSLFLTQLALFQRAAAQPAAPGQVPVVDSLSIRVLIEQNHDIFLRAPSPKAVRVRRVGAAFEDFRRTLHSEWGLSLALESKAGAETRNVLFDFGFQPSTLLNNMELLKVDPARFDALALSHGHFDHLGGLVGFLKARRTALKPDIRLYAGGEDNFCERKRPAGTAGHFADSGYLDRREVTGQKVEIVLCDKPTLIGGHALSTGHIRRATFEKVTPTQLVVYGRNGEIGCDPAAFAGRELNKPVMDQHWHEHGVCYNLRDRGLVVITGCGHAGVVNTVRQAMEVSGVRKLHAVLGGFHLAPTDDAYVKQSVAELKAMNPEVVIPMHCSGINFIEAMRDAMPDRLALSSTGSEFGFGA